MTDVSGIALGIEEMKERLAYTKAGLFCPSAR